jgi:hypothetical protein
MSDDVTPAAQGASAATASRSEVKNPLAEAKSVDARPRRRGWCPGDYFAKCRRCQCTFIGDKRAFECAGCAYAQPDEESDVVAVLRRNASLAIAEHYSLGMSNLLRMAADEIERLQALLRGRDEFIVSKDLFEELVSRLTLDEPRGLSAAEKPGFEGVDPLIPDQSAGKEE